MTLSNCYLSRPHFPGACNSVILPGAASCERFAIKHVKYDGKGRYVFSWGGGGEG